MDTETLLLWIYLVGIIIAWVPCTIPLVDPYDKDNDTALMVAMGLCIATLWPLVVIGFPIYLIVLHLTTPEK